MRLRVEKLEDSLKSSDVFSGALQYGELLELLGKF
jgi:hypothetical protein